MKSLQKHSLNGSQIYIGQSHSMFSTHSIFWIWSPFTYFWPPNWQHPNGKEISVSGTVHV
jgi:hypothetical protein